MLPYRRLEVWNRARAATIVAYQATRDFPREEAFGLSAQIRRAALSVGANIVEGSKRRSNRDYAHFLVVAEGSAAEAAYLIGLCLDLGLGDQARLRTLASEYDEIERMVYSLRRRITSSPERR